MAFSKDDIYTSSGTVMLQNFWTPYVSKYDTSSFYNWEQDNLPLYDLEERTHVLWEQLGFATSAGVPGLSLTVSADAPALTLEQNSTIFTDVSSCIAAIPKVVRFPVLIEVCNFGDLGRLELHNFRIEEGGSIEIINRAAVKAYNATTKTISVATPTNNEFAPIISQISSLDLSSTLFAPLADETCTSSLILSSRVLESENDSRVTSVNSFLYPKHTSRKAPLSVSLDNASFFTATANEFSVTPYESAVDVSEDNTISITDVSSINRTTLVETKKTDLTTDQAVNGLIYLNNCSKISVKNCDGPIFIRNFCVNGQAAPNSGQLVGIDINNSEVLLENCAAVRCREAGFKFNNSKVYLSRSAFAYRNYDLSSATVRTDNENLGIGFYAINSEISVSALFEADSEVGVAGDFQASGDDFILAASRNTTGMRLENSILHGGYARKGISENYGGIFTIEQNTKNGIYLNNSNIDLDGLLDIYGNYRGIFSNNSNIQYENIAIEDQYTEGILAKNSTITLKPFYSNAQTYRKQAEFLTNGQHIVLDNASTKDFVVLDHSPEIYGNMVFDQSHGNIPDLTQPMPSIEVRNNSNISLIHPNIQVIDYVTQVPVFGAGIKVLDNSKADLYGTKNGCTLVWGTPDYTSQKYNAGVYAANNSQVKFHGPTLIARFGVDVLAENNSIIEMSPPTIKGSDTIAAIAFDLSSQGNHTSVELHSTRACLVANKSSVINLRHLGGVETCWSQAPSGIAMQAFDYDSQDLTAVNQYVGSGSLQFYPNPADENLIVAKALDSLVGLGFTPTQTQTFATTTRLNRCLEQSTVISSTPAWADLDQLTQGGVCVRAVEDSVVNVHNVHFPIGPNNTTLKGTYYTTSGSDCDKLMIWNIADTSRLNAAFCSVSGVYPADTIYTGPSALWTSSDGAGGYTIASGAPENTPDTGRLSVLDAFGAGSAVWVIPSGVSYNSPFDNYYPVSGDINYETARLLSEAGMNSSGTTTYVYGAKLGTTNNKGIFRIYWSPKSSAKLLQTDLSGYDYGAWPHTGNFEGVVGPAYQIFAQGYNCSAPLSAVLPVGEINAYYAAPDLAKLWDGGFDGVADQINTVGFYYCSEFLEDNPSQCMLDESAADTFANAKNASLGTSGRPRRVTLYKSRGPADRSSEAYIGDVSGAYGFRSANIFDLRRDN